MNETFEDALKAYEKRLTMIRHKVPKKVYDITKPAEIEVNKFFFDGREIDRLMIVLRATGCSHYEETGGCGMCGHLDSTAFKKITTEEYIKQWQSVLNGSIKNAGKPLDLSDFPVVCVYNLGSFLNDDELPKKAQQEIFRSLEEIDGIEKVIIESRAEYVTDESLSQIKEVYSGIVEIGMGLEAITFDVRELCHHKKMPDLTVFEEAIRTLKENDFRALVYVNQKPPFLTECESIEEAEKTTKYAFNHGADAVSIEPTAVQNNTLISELYNLGLYEIPWLWSVIEVVKNVHTEFKNGNLDLRIGGYFDEAIISGSQGLNVGQNELFPTMTASNCLSCTPKVIDAIKEFNRTYDIKELLKIPHYDCCSDIWKSALKIRDSRPISQRVYDILGG